MLENFGKYFGPSTRDLSFRLRCPIFLLSKFVSQLKLIQSVVRVGILGICVTRSVLRVLFLGFWVSELQVPSPRNPVLGGPSCQGLVSQGPRVRVLGLRFPGLRVPGSRVSGSQDPGSQGLRVPCFGSQGPGS